MYNRLPEQKIDPDALKAWRIGGTISAVVYVICLGVILFLTIRFDWPYWIITALTLLAMAGSYLEIALIPKVRWERFRYEIREDEIDLMSGLLIRKRTLIPMVKVQHVDTKQGPIMRRFGLSSVTFSTAAGSHEIPALRERRADEVRGMIARLARITDDEL